MNVILVVDNSCSGYADAIDRHACEQGEYKKQKSFTRTLILLLKKNFGNKWKIDRITNSEQAITTTRKHKDNIKAIFLSGSNARFTQDTVSDATMLTNTLVMLLNPTASVFGICFGFQLLAIIYGGRVEEIRDKNGNAKGVFGKIMIDDQDYGNVKVSGYHNDYVSCLPFNEAHIDVRAMSDRHTQRIVMHTNNKMVVATQFHPEKSEEYGLRIIGDFLHHCEST